MRVDYGSASFLAAAMLRKFEGLSLAPYFCPAGRLTVGYGHVILPGEVSLRGGVSEAEAEALLLNDLAWALYAVRCVLIQLNDGQAAALASLVFNIGRGAWEKSTIRALVAAGDMAGAAGQFERWSKVAGVVNAGLLKRRRAEKRVFGGESWNG